MNVDPEIAKATLTTPEFSFDGRTVDAKCVKVYDGDTIQVVFRAFPDQPPRRFHCRMLGYNTAEMHSKNATERTAAQAAEKYLADIVLGKIITLKLGKYEKYGRILTTVTAVDGVARDVNGEMVKTGHGQPYTGEGDKLW